jgi:hypothetical protein
MTTMMHLPTWMFLVSLCFTFGLGAWIAWGWGHVKGDK